MDSEWVKKNNARPRWNKIRRKNVQSIWTFVQWTMTLDYMHYTINYTYNMTIHIYDRKKSYFTKIK